MKKVTNWFLNNLKWIFALVAVLITGAVVAGTMIGSYQNYLAYEKAYYENDLEVRSNAPAEPLNIDIDDEFVSKYKNTKIVDASELTVTTTQSDYIVEDYLDLTKNGGSITLKTSIDKKAFVDVDFLVSSTKETKQGQETVYGVKSLLEDVDFIINGETMEGDVTLPNSSGEVEWHHLVMNGFALPEGEVTITIKSKSGKNSSMPQLQNISLFSSEALA